MTDHYRHPITGTTLLNAAWSVCAQSPGSVADPSQLQSADWLEAPVPGTVAAALQRAGRWNHEHPIDLDASDWWYRTTFTAPTRNEEPCVLCFDGLATLADVWFNGERILSTDNMFRAYRVDVADKLKAENELAICFRSLNADLKKKRPRPRWKTNLINNQQLRWQRTTLLGHIPGWSPPVPAVGPWRDVRLECAPVLISDVKRVATVDGNDGVVSFSAQVNASVRLASARLCIGGHEHALSIENGCLSGEVRFAKAKRWQPHTHGEPHLYDCKLVIQVVGQGSDLAPDALGSSEDNRWQAISASDATIEPEQSATPATSLRWPATTDAATTFTISLAPVGFRSLEVRTEPGFALRINGDPIHCRGACWTVSDIFMLSADEASLRHDLTLARDAGMNMVRIGGTMVYENDAFYRLCDELGILVWQDFMFANMDYPVDDGAFAENIAIEARQQLTRLAQHPCVVVYCGSSEIEQQAAMLGMPRELWRNQWFGETLPALCELCHPGTAYVPSSPSGGVMPFHTATGITHYYGIGAYLRSMRELRQADVKFTSECLGFANLPEPETLNEIMGGLVPVMHHPKWKARVPRDTGAGWDFEDVRDHYLAELFSVDPTKLRCFDLPRYLELSRITSGEMMSRVMNEWRSTHSRNAGALIWFFKDLWPATGWGIIDSHGIPKAAYYQLKRTWQSRQLTVTDEGLDGLHLHLTNETSEPIDGFLEIQLLREPSIVTAKHEVPVTVVAQSNVMRCADELIGHFTDVGYAYRFGPQAHHVVVATWFNADREVLSEAFHITRNRDPEPQPASIQIVCEGSEQGCYRVAFACDRFLQYVRLSAKGFLPSDNYFHLIPGRSKAVTFKPVRDHRGPLRATVEALNLLGEQSIDVRPPASV